MKIEVPYFAIELGIDPESLSGLSSESLRQMKIFPSGWKIEGEKSGPRFLSGFSFENGVSFLANEDTLRFSEPPHEKSLIGTHVPKIVRTYVASMPHLVYLSVDIQFMGHFRETKKEGSLFIARSLEQSPWGALGGSLVNAELGLQYVFGDSLCELSVKRMQFGKGDDSYVGVITFFAKFVHFVEAKSVKKRLALINSILDDMNTDLNRYQSMANQLMSKKENS
ncbi:MAG: hypothetical protein ACLP5H_07790 [Desulfomonilaceae bacterium]